MESLEINNLDYENADFNVVLSLGDESNPFKLALSMYTVGDVSVVISNFQQRESGQMGILITSDHSFSINGEEMTEGIQEGVVPILLKENSLHQALPEGTQYTIVQISKRSKEDFDAIVSRLRNTHMKIKKTTS